MVRVLLADDHPLRPDLIITDISMPFLNGLEAAEQIRTSGCTALIVFLTVHAESDFVDACLAAGGAAHVSKISMGVDLLPAIHRALRLAHD